MKKAIFGILIIAVLAVQLFGDKLDINSCPDYEIKKLPLPAALKLEIIDYLKFRGPVENIFELYGLENMTGENFRILKEYVSAEPVMEDEASMQRLDDLYYIFERFGTDEGFSEGISDEWEDQLLSPKNINELTFREIMNYPSVSPVDAYAVIDYRNTFGDIKDSRKLRNVPFLSYYGYRNMNNYVTFGDEAKKLHFHYQFKLNNVPYFDETNDVLLENVIPPAGYEEKTLENTYWGKMDMGNADFAQSSKIRIRYGNQIKAGFTGIRNLGEKDTNFKGYLGFEDIYKSKWFNLKKAYLGNYRVALGNGLLMENTDYFTPRKTGRSFGKSIIGLIGDISGTDEFRFTGGAAEFSMLENHLSSILFYSRDKKDAVVNPDDEVVSYIVLKPKPTESLLEEVQETIEDNYHLGLRIERDYFEEETFGMNLEGNYENAFLGYTFYESIYDKKFAPLKREDWADLLNSEQYGYEVGRKGKISQVDNEFFMLYDSGRKDYRRFTGFNFRYIMNELALEGELGALDKDGDFLPMGDDPTAWCLKALVQKNSFYFLALYRDVDIRYDNPYARGFSEKKRFDDSMFDKYPYALNNQLLGNLYLNSPWMQAEKGLYMEARYQFSQYLTLNKAYIDLFTRKADGRPTMRFQSTLRFQPVNPIRIDWRQKVLVNNSYNILARGVSKTYNFYLRATFNLSKMDRISLAYNYEQTYFPPYPYLSNNPEPGVDNLGTGGTLLKGDAIILRSNHHITDAFNIEGAVCLFNTNGTSLYDFEDSEIDFIEGRGIKTWLTISNRIGRNIIFRIKYKFKHYLPRSKSLRKWWNEPVDNSEGDNPLYYLYNNMENIRQDNSMFRIQLDYIY